jgi:hypothetical protein
MRLGAETGACGAGSGGVKLVTGPITFTATASRATLSRGRVIYATGTATASRLRLHSRRALPPGHYTLTLTSHHKTTRQTITIT